MKNTVKLFSLIALTALIGFAACDNNSGSTNSGGDITWNAVANGTADSANSTAITFTFSAAVSGLTADNITLTPTASVTKGALSGGGASWVLGIAVQTAGTVSVKVTKDGVSAAAQNVTVHKASGAAHGNPVSGRTTYIDGNQIVFSASSGASGTYTLNGQKTENDGSFSVGENNKWIWTAKAEGAYAWSESAQTLTLTPEKVADNAGQMTTKTAALPLFVGWLQGEIEREITDRLAWSELQGETRATAEAAVLASRNEVNGTAYVNLTELINYLAAIRFDEMFTVSSYTHIFSSDGESLILLEALPPSVGTDQLAGQVYYGVKKNLLDVLVQDTDHVFIFAATGKTYTEVLSSETIATGSYSYDSTAKRVYLKPAVRNGKTPEQYYETTDYYEEFNKYPTEADHRVSQTFQYFNVIDHDYDSVKKFFPDVLGSGDIEPL